MSWQPAARIAVAVAILVVAAASVRSCSDANSWEQRAQGAERFAEEQMARADSAERGAAEIRSRADSLARVAGRNSRQVRQRVEEARTVVVPDTCREFVTQRDSLIDAALASAEEWRSAYDSASVAYDSLAIAYALQKETGDSLLTVLRARPRPRPKFLPEIGVFVGPSVGTVGAGISVGVGLVWRF